jgi:hypothetical protein
VSRKSKSFYYLLPGQGRGARKRFLRNMIVSIVVGLFVSGLLIWVFYLLET